MSLMQMAKTSALDRLAAESSFISVYAIQLLVVRRQVLLCWGS